MDSTCDHEYKTTHGSEWGRVTHVKCNKCGHRYEYRDPRSQGCEKPTWFDRSRDKWEKALSVAYMWDAPKAVRDALEAKKYDLSCLRDTFSPDWTPEQKAAQSVAFWALSEPDTDWPEIKIDEHMNFISQRALGMAEHG